MRDDSLNCFKDNWLHSYTMHIQLNRSTQISLTTLYKFCTYENVSKVKENIWISSKYLRVS